MVGLTKHFGAVVALGAFFPALISAQNTTAATTAASTFYLDETQTQFSVNIANDSSDVFIYFTSPAYSWVSVGFGDKMADSLMLVMYPNNNGDNVTISPRYGSGHTEPAFTPNVAIDILPGTTVNDSMFVLNARCRNCRVWPNGFLDPKDTAQPMIYAFGPGSSLYSDSQSAGLKRHVRYGFFTMDMVAATGTGRVPSQSSAISGVTMVGEMVKDHDRASFAHAVVGCLALFVVWPLNVLVAGFFKNIKIHVGVSVLVMALLIVAYALGGVASAQFIRSKSFNSPHQILAFLSLLPILLLSLLPIPSLSTLHAKIPRLHGPLTALAFLLLVLTGGLGLGLASQTRAIILIYTAIALIVCVFIVTVQSCIRRRGSAYARSQGGPRRGSGGDEDDDRNYMLGKMEESSRSTSSASLGGAPPPPPAYGMPYGGQFGADGGQYQYQQSQQQQRSPYGGGTMPGPQYLLNMHPGVPVQVSRM
ncbi:hypothetical protein N0V83_001847 [Neocucurbitaria cava]|uniref:DOMON domain-containing protein n=1 Tax=Neocucurbitaria cava TaxID=798079 RepID=A0A9W8YE56_9PLEO|nr:hypothetical protein N0V83_001847 [Neocucurbitaria cava]